MVQLVHHASECKCIDRYMSHTPQRCTNLVLDSQNGPLNIGVIMTSATVCSAQAHKACTVCPSGCFCRLC